MRASESKYKANAASGRKAASRNAAALPMKRRTK
ncbi:transcription elongation factor GreA [Nitrobacter sp. Nb-311A]|nr:transcription elongation factor GreA [Nitrobacter sp. Nb-311A]